MNRGQDLDHRAALLAQLNSSIDNFFINGGSVQDLPSRGYVPPRPRRDLDPTRTPAREPISTRAAKRAQRLEEIRKLAETMTYAEAMVHTGKCQSALVRAAAAGGFKFQPNPNRGKGNLGKQLSDPVEDRLKSEQIIAFRNIGMTRADVVRELQISFKQLGRILREFGEEFPTTADRPAKRKL